MIALKQITNIEIFAFIAVLVFKLLSHKVLFIYKKDNTNCLKAVGYSLRKYRVSQENYCKTINN